MGLRVVKRVCGALSGFELMRVVALEEWKQGRVRVRVSVVGVKVRVVVLEKSGFGALVSGGGFDWDGGSWAYLVSG